MGSHLSIPRPQAHRARYETHDLLDDPRSERLGTVLTGLTKRGFLSYILTYADWLVRSGQPQFALDILKAVAKRTDRAEALTMQAHVALGQAEQAKAVGEAVLANHPDWHETTLRLAHIHNQSNDAKQAKRLLKTVPPDVEDPTVQHLRVIMQGGLAVENQAYDKAVDTLSALARKPHQDLVTRRTIQIRRASARKGEFWRCGSATLTKIERERSSAVLDWQSQ